MKGIEQSWAGLTEPEDRELAAQSQLDAVVDLLKHPAWPQLEQAMTAQIADTMKDLARSSIEDEQNRGIIRALDHVQQMPDRLIRAASAELDKHR